MSSGAREREKASVFFYRDNYRRSARLLTILFVLMLIQTGVIAYQLMTRPEPQYFAATNTGKIIELTSLTRAAANRSTQTQVQSREAVGLPSRAKPQSSGIQ